MEECFYRGNFMKKQSFFVLLLSAFLLTGCNVPEPTTQSKESSQTTEPAGQSSGSEQSQQSQQTSQSQPASTSSANTNPSGTALQLTAPANDIHTDLQYSYLKDPDWRNIKAYIPAVNAEDNKKHDDLSKPKALELAFADLADASTYYVQVSKDNTFANAPVLQTQAKKYDFYNAEIGVKYYYRAAVSEEALANATVKEYQVADTAPRNLKVDGMINFRDQGGWKSSLVTNGVIKQGLYYRCAKFDSITAAGKQTIKELGIKVDVDMRDSYQVPNTSKASSTDWPVEILKASVASGTESTRWEGTNGIAATYKKIFEAIAVADQKPIALHCTHGADRTGIMSFFLMGLLGASKDDIGRDYVLTRFAGERAVLPDNEIKNWMDKTEALQGATFADKIYKHLNEDFQIEKDTLETIREKFVPGYTRPAGA